MFKILARNKIDKRSVLPGDTVSVKYTSDAGKTDTVCQEEITKAMELDEAAVFEFEDELDMKEGVGGIVGKSKSTEKKGRYKDESNS